MMSFLRASITFALVCAWITGCGDASRETAAKNSFNPAPQGSTEDIAEACGRAGFVMSVFTIDKLSAAEAYLDPVRFPGYDVGRQAHARRTALYLTEGLATVNARHFGSADRWFDRSIEELGWKVLAPDRIEASEYAWPNLEQRVDWCFDHIDMKAYVQAVRVAPQAPKSAVAAVAIVDPYRTELKRVAGDSTPIVVEHEPD